MSPGGSVKDRGGLAIITDAEQLPVPPWMALPRAKSVRYSFFQCTEKPFISRMSAGELKPNRFFTYSDRSNARGVAAAWVLATTLN
jgi:hypothetical protein